MIGVELLQEWVNGLPDDAMIGVDDGGLRVLWKDGKPVEQA
jgi:hypothetical protein